MKAAATRMLWVRMDAATGHHVSCLSGNTKNGREIKGARQLTEYAAQSKWGVVHAAGGVPAISRAKLDAVGIFRSEETLITSLERENCPELVASGRGFDIG